MKIFNLAISFISVAMLASCADSGGGSGQSCEIPKPSIEVLRADQNSNDISGYQNFIIKFKDDGATSTTGLQPSGKPVQEYRVKGMTLKALSGSSYTMQLSQNREERQKILSELSQREDVEYVEPDYPVYQIESQDQPVSAEATYNLWSHSVASVDPAWQYSTGSSDVVIAIVDSGLDYTHNDLKDNVWKNTQEIPGNGIDDDHDGFVDDVYGWNFVSNNGQIKTTTSSNHGTHVAGIIGATNATGKGVTGVAKKVKMMGLKFIGETGTGVTSNAIKAIDYAISKKVFAINNSWGSSGFSQALGDAITRAEKAGILFVVAAGNGSGGIGFDISQSHWYPASYPNSNILNVAATTSADKLASFSNFSFNMVEVAAPGFNILSTASDQTYVTMSGTSMAAPFVTGLAVLVKAANPALNFRQVKSIIAGSVDGISSMKNIIQSGGRVNVLKAVKAAASGVSELKSPLCAQDYSQPAATL